MSVELTDLDQPPSVSPETSHRLFQGGLAGLVGALVYCYVTTGGDIHVAQLLASAIIVFSAIPALNWARTKSTWFPAFEISMLACITFYAIPLFKSSDELASYAAASRSQSALVVLIYVACANFGFSSLRTRPRVPHWAVETLLPAKAIHWVPIGLLINVAYAYVSIFLKIIPGNIEGILRALFFGIGIMSTFILARMWGLGLLDRRQRIVFVLGLLAYLVVTFSTLYLIGGISLLALTLISYASARRKIPWEAIGIFGVILALLHLGKPEMRKKYWDPATNESRGAPVASLTDLPAYYGEWFDYSIQALEQHETDPEKKPTSIFARASLIQMICLSVDEVPNRKPYLLGESYVDIPALIIPRLLWPEKPSSLLANIRLAVYFNLVSEDSGFSVSIAFGPLAEAYINFGYLGVALLGVLMGAGFKRVSMMSDGAPQFSAMGIFMILLTAWSFQVEQVMATWLSSLFQAAVICIGLPALYRKLTVV
ncbi:MAG: hypothetical protein WC205_13645 [Opitutaceae bacterium]|jgi:hypothetical protein